MYSDREKSPFTKYTNLHLGRAYEVMSPKDWYNKVLHYGEQNPIPPEDGQFVKDLLTEPEEETATQKRERLVNRLALMARMIDCGYDALWDAFCVMKKEGIFNIFNSRENKIEEFKISKADCYSQAQCAIVIERVFSRLYRYLKFKSTTFETFQRHFNVDMGYKYLDPDSILNSDVNKGVYYHDSDVVKYIRYLDKLDSYSNSELGNIGLTSAEKTVLSHFKEILSKQIRGYILDGVFDWNLCPICQRRRDASKVEPRSPESIQKNEPAPTLRKALMEMVSRPVDEED